MKTVIRSIILLGILFSTLTLAEAPKAKEDRLTPKAALERLLQGNERFVNDKSDCPDRNQDRRTATASKQKPFAVILGCSDSRVPPELAFDQGIGDIFVVRVAGNVVGATELDSIEYSAIHNHSSIIMVLGHENCGAVTAVLANNTKDVEAIADLMRPGVDLKDPNLVNAIEANVHHSVHQVKNSPVISKLIKAGKIDVVGAYYELSTGKVNILEKK